MATAPFQDPYPPNQPFSRPSLPAIPSGQRAILITDKPLPVPAYPSSDQFTFTVLTRIKIAAPAALVFSALLNTAHWPEWNSFSPSATVSPSPNLRPLPKELMDALPDLFVQEGEKWLRQGDNMVMSINMFGRGSSLPQIANPEKITRVEVLYPEEQEGRKGFRITWEAKSPFGSLLRAERVQEVVVVEGGCEYVTWESMGGLMATAVKLSAGGKLVERFGDWGEDLKGWCEKLEAESVAKERPEGNGNGAAAEGQ